MDINKLSNDFIEKNWTDIKASSSWQIFKIMAEFVEGFDKLAKIGPCVSVFGSARTPETDRYYQLAYDIGFQLTQSGWGVITGGGPGIMEAANKGAMEANGKSVGISISLPFETEANRYIDRDKLIHFDYFFVRKVMLLKYSKSIVVMPGGLGTLDELFESLTLIQTHKVGRFPIILVGKSYWSGLLDWMRNEMLANAYIRETDFDLFHVVDSAEETIAHINNYYKEYQLSPNF